MTVIVGRILVASPEPEKKRRILARRSCILTGIVQIMENLEADIIVSELLTTIFDKYMRGNILIRILVQINTKGTSGVLPEGPSVQ